MPRTPKRIWRDYPTDFLDIGMDPLFKAGRRDEDHRYVSAAEVLLHKQFEKALAGDLASFRGIIKMAKKNQRYTDLRRAYLDSRQLPTVHYGYASDEGGKRSDYFSRDAGTILDIMVRVRVPGPPEMEALDMDLSFLRYYLQPWVLEAAEIRRPASEGPMDLSQYNWSSRCSIEPFDYTKEPWFTPPPPEEKRSSQETRFAKGRSGNPRGRPRTMLAEAPFDDFLYRVVSVNIGGTKRECSRLEALVHSANMRAANGDEKFLAYLSDLYVEESFNRWNHSDDWRNEALRDPLVHAAPRNVSSEFDGLPPGATLRRLDIISRGTSSRYLFRPWLVDLALSRLGKRQLTIEEQKEVMRSTSCRRKVSWPDWWEVRPWEKGGHKL